MRKKMEFQVFAAYDTETTNIQAGEDSKAFPILFIYNDLHAADLRDYTPGRDDSITLARTTAHCLRCIECTIEDGRAAGVVPVVAAYNLMFDLQPILHALRGRYDMQVTAQSSTHVYVLDLLDQITGEPLLRFWDTFFLEMRGLAAMGRTCGFAKAVGDWDYSLIRTPETPLTDLEEHYAARDVQVIPAYLRFLLESNSWLTPEMFGFTIITKTSLVRQMARHELGALTFRTSKGVRLSLFKAFQNTCTWEAARDYDSYALRKACFRGGFTFTAANNAHHVFNRVASLDVTSMHHLFLNGRKVPVRFSRASGSEITRLARNNLTMSRAGVLKCYENPMPVAFHAPFTFSNIHLKRGTIFEREGIALIPQAKFYTTIYRSDEDDPLNDEADNLVRAAGYKDLAENPQFAYSKLITARRAVLYLNEIELWALSRVYEWDSLEAGAGEIATKFYRPPDYATLQSNVLFERKSAAKKINKNYKQGTPYPFEIPSSVPPGIADALRAATATNDFIRGWYENNVKGQFNGCYGVQAMDEVKPSYDVDEAAELFVDPATRASSDNYEALAPERSKVFYTYGMRIVGGSRLHLVLAIELLAEAFGDRIQILAGDTDSIKMACGGDVTDAEIMAALEPLHAAARHAIEWTQRRVRALYPGKASKFENVGEFEIEDCGGSTRYAAHMEAWPKARLSYDGEHVHVTCAGLSRPEGAYTFETAAEDFMRAGYSFEKVAPALLGYNVEVGSEICHALQRTRPRPCDMFIGEVTDYRGDTSHVVVPASQALYPVARELGDTSKDANRFNVRYAIRSGRHLPVEPRRLYLENGYVILQSKEDGRVIMKARATRFRKLV